MVLIASIWMMHLLLMLLHLEFNYWPILVLKIRHQHHPLVGWYHVKWHRVVPVVVLLAYCLPVHVSPEIVLRVSVQLVVLLLSFLVKLCRLQVEIHLQFLIDYHEQVSVVLEPWVFILIFCNKLNRSFIFFTDLDKEYKCKSTDAIRTNN